MKFTISQIDKFLELEFTRNLKSVNIVSFFLRKIGKYILYLRETKFNWFCFQLSFTEMKMGCLFLFSFLKLFFKKKLLRFLINKIICIIYKG
jgi:hypothetical protein